MTRSSARACGRCAPRRETVTGSCDKGGHGEAEEAQVHLRLLGVRGAAPTVDGPMRDV